MFFCLEQNCLPHRTCTSVLDRSQSLFHFMFQENLTVKLARLISTPSQIPDSSKHSNPRKLKERQFKKNPNLSWFEIFDCQEWWKAGLQFTFVECFIILVNFGGSCKLLSSFVICVSVTSAHHVQIPPERGGHISDGKTNLPVSDSQFKYLHGNASDEN